MSPKSNSRSIEDDIFWSRTIFVGTLLLSAIVGGKMLLPQHHQNRAALQTNHDLNQQIEATQSQMRGIKNLGKDLRQTKQKILNTTAILPSGDPMIWLPGVIHEHFAGLQIANNPVQIHAVRKNPLHPDIRHVYAGVEIPLSKTRDNTRSLLLAVAGLEENRPALRISNFTISTSPQDPAQRVATVNFEALYRE